MLFSNDARLTRPAAKTAGILETKIKPMDYDQSKEVTPDMYRFFKKYMDGKFVALVKWCECVQDDVPEGRNDLYWRADDAYNKVSEVAEEVEDQFQIVCGIDLANADYRKADTKMLDTLLEINLLRRAFPKAKTIEELYEKARGHVALACWLRSIILSVFVFVLAFIALGLLEGLSPAVSVASVALIALFLVLLPSFIKEHKRWKRQRYGDL